MKSFTAKEFSRCPAKVYEAAREDGCAYIEHDRFSGEFKLFYENHIPIEDHAYGDIILNNGHQYFCDGEKFIRMIYEKAPD